MRFFTSCVLGRSLLANPLTGNVEGGVGVANADLGLLAEVLSPIQPLVQVEVVAEDGRDVLLGGAENNNKLFTSDSSVLFSSLFFLSNCFCKYLFFTTSTLSMERFM